MSKIEVRIDSRWDDHVENLFKSIVGLTGYHSSFPDGYDAVFKAVMSGAPMVFLVNGRKGEISNLKKLFEEGNNLLNRIRIAYSSDSIDVDGGLGEDWKKDWLEDSDALPVTQEVRLTVYLPGVLDLKGKVDGAVYNEFISTIMEYIKKSYQLNKLCDTYKEAMLDLNPRHSAA